MLPNLSLPIVTGIYARGANTIGGFGLVGGWLTIAYHVSDLGLNRPQEAFTNHYHRTGGEGGQGTDLGPDQTDRMGHTVKGGRARRCGKVIRA